LINGTCLTKYGIRYMPKMSSRLSRRDDCLFCTLYVLLFTILRFFTDILEASLDSTPALFNALTISNYVPKNIHNVAVDKLMVVRAR
jgi:hypothetical protein